MLLMLKVAIFNGPASRKDHSVLTRVSHCKHFVACDRLEDEIGRRMWFDRTSTRLTGRWEQDRKSANRSVRCRNAAEPIPHIKVYCFGIADDTAEARRYLMQARL
jgi:hypothetical protein